MTQSQNLDLLSNSLVTSDQVRRYQEAEIECWGENGQSIRFEKSRLTQAAGILLRLPQEVIATAIVLLQRYLILNLPESDGRLDLNISSAATIYLTAKLSFTPLSPRSVINVYAYLASSDPWLAASTSVSPPPPPANSESDATRYFVSEGTYERERLRLFEHESIILDGVGFDARVTLPYTLALMYIQTLGVSTPKLAKRVLKHLNGGLLSPQLLYLTHQPNALAVAAIYLAARETDTKLVNYNWWEVFDVDREDLGFLVLAFGSLNNFVQAEKEKWKDGKFSLS